MNRRPQFDLKITVVSFYYVLSTILVSRKNAFCRTALRSYYVFNYHRSEILQRVKSSLLMTNLFNRRINFRPTVQCPTKNSSTYTNWDIYRYLLFMFSQWWWCDGDRGWCGWVAWKSSHAESYFFMGRRFFL